MPRIAKPLTNTEIKLAKPTTKEYSLFDGSGLALRVLTTGSKQWVFNYSKPHIKNRTNIGLGTYPDLSLADARAKKDEYRQLLARGIDPKEHRDNHALQIQDLHANTLEHVSIKWLALKKTKVSASHCEDIRRSLELHIFPALGKIPLYKIKATRVIEVLQPIAAKGGLETVKRLTQRINEIMIYALNCGLVESNPLSGISKAFETPKKRHMLTIKPEQLPELMLRLSLARIKITTRCLIEWQLHTMVRPSEAAGTAWAEIDFDSSLWNIPAERMKKKKPHTVPLSPQALALLNFMRPISAHREFVFPSDKNPKNPAHSQTANMALKRMGYQGVLVSHGLRSIASTAQNEHGFHEDIIEAALSHTGENEVRGAYNHAIYIERRKPLMCWWSEQIENAAHGNMSLSAADNTLRITGS